MGILHTECDQQCATCSVRNKCVLGNCTKDICSKRNQCYKCEDRTKKECEVD